MLGSQSSTGDVSGTLPGSVMLSDSSFFNELLANVTLGNSFSFEVDSTNLGPTSGSFPDEFSLFILDNSGNSLISTSDPTGGDALATIDLTGGAAPTVTGYTTDVSFTSPTPVPEPASMLLLVPFAVVLLVMWRRRANQARSRNVLTACCAALVLALPGSVSAQTNITSAVAADSSINVTLSGLRLNRATHTFDSVVTVTNTSAQPIDGPFYLAVSGIDVPTVTFSNSAGQLPNQLPYIPLATGAQLLPNTPVAAGTLKFSDPQNVLFHINTGVWDAASLPHFSATTLRCPTSYGGYDGIVLGDTGAGPAYYTPPTDSAGRTASCSPAPNAWLPLGDNWIQCTTSGGSAPPASCAFDYQKQAEIVLGPPAGTADVALKPCPVVLLAGGAGGNGTNIVPAGVGNVGTLINMPILAFTECDFGTPGTSLFTIVNNGPYTAYNVEVALGVPAQYKAYAVKFSKANSCIEASSPVMPLGAPYPGGDVLNCFFTSMAPGETITATVGVDLPSVNGASAVPSLYAQVAVDPTQNTDPDLTDNSISFEPALPPTGVTANWPQPSPACEHDPDDHTFDVLLDTCGVPSIVVQIVTGVFLGGATILGGAGVGLFATGVIDPLSYLFNAADEVGVLVR